MKKILIIAAHPDDEILGCGASISYFNSLSYDTRVLFINEGVSSRFENKNDSLISDEIISRENMAKEVAKFLDFKILDFLRYENLRMQNIDMLSLVKKIMGYLKDFKPDIIFTHHPGDLNSDHGTTYNASFTACRPNPGFMIKNFYTFEIPSSTDWASSHSEIFLPNMYIDISNFLEKKIEALKFYDKEIRSFPHSRSIESIKALSIIRGGAFGCMYAEAFSTIKSSI
tara:strand:- start:78 stop:761 length:684 start_codon:yes stop_codon:yes gene_type:complete